MIRHIPLATYRIQFNQQCGFKKVKQIVPYLARLGISDIYASPVFKAKSSSTHGYDMVDPNQLNPGLGQESDFEELIKEIRTHDLFWLQDIVVNHMAFDTENALLMDVLENGPNSKFFKFFDIEWDHHFDSLKGRLLAPFLTRFYAESLRDGEIQLAYGEEGFTICYHDLAFPLKLNFYSKILQRNDPALEKDHPDLIKLNETLDSLDKLTDHAEVHFQYEHIREAKQALWNLYLGNPSIKNSIDGTVHLLNGKKGDEESFNGLDALISGQAFRLSFWKVAIGEINYRRFFNINELICLKTEDPDVFNYMHSLLFSLVEKGMIDGLRIDHVDGLYDPANYLKRLREKAGPLYIVVEKILGPEEKLPLDWQVQGTTGYDFLNYVNGIFCDRENRKDFIKTYYRFTGSHTPYDELVYTNKLLAVRNMGGTIENLAYLMKKITGNDRYCRDITFYELKRALSEFLVNLPAYRTYITHETYSETDKACVKDAIAKAYARMPGLLYELNFIAKFFLADIIQPLSDEQKKARIDFVMKMQQFAPPLTAKGFEDTVLYIYNKLISLNEVGGDPNRFGIPLKDFHAFNRTRQHEYPHSLNATSTHDTKKGEDVRARINVLSEIPAEWARNLKSWKKLNLPKKKILNSAFAPDENDEYSLYQILIGSIPFSGIAHNGFIERIKAYMVKAVREAKVHTAWIKPDIEYENACCAFIDEILKSSDENSFLKEFLSFQQRIAFYGIFNSLSQSLLKMTCPGIPDFYQGTELWDLSLVDPDNRQPVDFDIRNTYLEEIIRRQQDPGFIPELLSAKEDGRIKLFLTYKTLQARKKYIQLFQEGDYVALKTGGRFKENVFAFLRKSRDEQVVVIAPRLTTALVKEGVYPLNREVWNDTFVIIPKSTANPWQNMITGEEIPGGDSLSVGEILKVFPAGLLIQSNRSQPGNKKES